MADKQKVLICGDVNGRFKSFFAKIEAINKKSGPFDFLFCVGNFFGPDNSELEPYKTGQKQISVPTYIIGPNREEDVKHYPEGDCCDVCENLTYLGKQGFYTSVSGLKIAYLSGLDKNSGKSGGGVTFDANDVEVMRNSCLKGQPQFRGVDILLTSQWPAGVTNLDEAKPDFSYTGSELVSWLATQIKPRYHACGLEDIHYERAPYRNQNQNEDGTNSATRFIALASVLNKEKKKWLYAFNLTPIDKTRMSELMMKTTDETKSPYPESMVNSKPGKKSVQKTQYFFDMNSKDDRKKHKKAKFEFDQSKCWFCLSSKDVSRHLVISEGKEVYLALAKGGVVDDHFLILPIMHHQSLSTLPDHIKEEFRKYKEAIKEFYAATNRVPVFFERNFKTSHCQLQAVPIHENQAPVLKEAFEEIASIYHIKIQELNNDLHEVAPAGTCYFYVELPDGQRLFHKIKKDFPLQFGREVVCSDRILDIPERFDWKDCQLDEKHEAMLAEKIKLQFKPYNAKHVEENA